MTFKDSQNIGHSHGPEHAEPSYRLTVEERPGYTYACIWSKDPNFKPDSTHIRRILEQCAGPACERIVIENQTGSAFARRDFIQTATQFPGFGLAHTRVAIVDSLGPRTEQAGVNIVIGKTSSISVRGFASLRDAEAWLLDH